MLATIFEMFAHSCRTQGNKALFERPGQPDISYAEAALRTRHLAAALADLGVTPGDRVAVQLDKCPDAVLLYLACLQIGAVFLPLNTAYTATEIDYFIGDAEPALFICRSAELELHRARVPRALTVEALGIDGDGTLGALAHATQPRGTAVAGKPDDPAAILYTSGTTGRSKGAVLTQGNLASNCQALIDAWRFGANDRLLHALPIFHTHGLFVACNMALASGATMIFLTAFETDELITLMGDATVLMGVPTFYTRLLTSERLNHESTAGMRLFVSGSAPLSAETHRAFEQRTGHAILERYGMTETCMIASNPYAGERRAGTVGFPLDGVEIRITDRESDEVLPHGEVGAIEVRGPNVFSGYWRMPEKTAAEFRNDGFFITGDLGFIDKDGYLNIVGRDKDLVISGGYNVYPKELETLLDAHEAIAESAVFGLPHPDLGEAVTAVVVRRKQAHTDEQALRASLADSVARYKQPKRVLFLEELPRNVMGKVQKNQLRQRFANLYTQGDNTERN